METKVNNKQQTVKEVSANKTAYKVNAIEANAFIKTESRKLGPIIKVIRLHSPKVTYSLSTVLKAMESQKVYPLLNGDKLGSLPAIRRTKAGNLCVFYVLQYMSKHSSDIVKASK